MDFEEEENSFYGSVPEFGAIFMSNIATKRVCFKKKVMGSSLSRASFVKKIKCGMVLFLFEYERRELFGVFRASSDGGMNIVPHAFSSSAGVDYPAQVSFTPIWKCSPLSEPEFREAISANYYSQKKFNFGLSRDQVQNLLLLFSTKKLRTKLPPRQLTRVNRKRVGENGSVVDDENHALSNNSGLLNEDDFKSSPVVAYRRNFWDRDTVRNSDTRPGVDMMNNEYGVCFSEGKYQDNVYSDSPSRKREDDDERIFFNDVPHNMENDRPLMKDMRLTEGRQFMMDDTFDNCNHLPSGMHSDDLVDPIHVSRKNYGAMVTERERIVNISNINFETGMTRFASHSGNSLLNGGFEERHNMDNTYSCDRKSDLGKIVENASSQPRLIHDSTESKHLKNYATISDITSAPFGSTSQSNDVLYGDPRHPVGCNRREHSPDAFVDPSFHGRTNNRFQSPVKDVRGRENTNDFLLGSHPSNKKSTFCQNVDEEGTNADWYLKKNAAKATSYVENFDRFHENTDEHLIGLPASNEQSTFCQTAAEQRADTDWYGKNNAKKAASYVENFNRVHENTNKFVLGSSVLNEQSIFGQNVSEQQANTDWYRMDNAEKAASFMESFDMHHRSHNEMKQITPPNSGMSFFETALSRITEAVNFESSPSKLQTVTTIARAPPSDHELSTSHYGNFSSHLVGGRSSSIHEKNSHCLRGMPYHEKVGGTTGHPDITFADHRERSYLPLQPRIRESHFEFEYAKNLGLHSYEVLPSQDMASMAVAGPGDAAPEGENAGFSHLSFDLKSYPSHATERTSLPPGIRECMAVQETDGMIMGDEFSQMDQKNNYDLYETNTGNDGTYHNLSSEMSGSGFRQFNRKSVFSRLSANKCSLKEKQTGYVTSHNDLLDTPVDDVPDTSVDDVMGMLQSQLSQVLLVKRQMKFKPLGKCPDNSEVTTCGKHDNDLKKNVPQATEQNVISRAARETRVVDFGRRSDLMKKSHDRDSSVAEKLAIAPKHRQLKRGLMSKEKMPSEIEIADSSMVKEMPFIAPNHRQLKRDLMSKEKIPSENEIVKDPACKPTKRRKLVRPFFGNVGACFLGNHHSDETSNDNPIFVKAHQHCATSQEPEPVNEPPLSGQDSRNRDPDGNITNQNSGSSNVLPATVCENKDSNMNQRSDNPVFVKARQHCATSQEPEPVIELPLSGHDSRNRDPDGNITNQNSGSSNVLPATVCENKDSNMKQRSDNPVFVKARQHCATSQEPELVLELPLSGHDSRNRDPDGNITNQNSGSSNVLPASVCESKDSNMKQRSECENYSSKMHDFSSMEPDEKYPGKLSQIEPLETPQCTHGISCPEAGGDGTSEATKVADNVSCLDDLQGVEKCFMS
ncbi:unnamed protein product [Cuscuta epithymum]|uniref:DCD domain-containing protein n=1 Tax=Cuscuta epithymum TaxID=186058 RepID=A0AAV0ED82_9ASTE|nr:unnamed protein product [Cuscuta epithymum]